jgi:glycerate 2-kinase
MKIPMDQRGGNRRAAEDGKPRPAFGASPEAARDDALDAAMHALAAVDPTRLVKAKVRTGALDDWFEDRHAPRWIRVIALGKAAPRMVWGLVEADVPFSGFAVSPRGVLQPNVDTVAWYTGEHPVPGAGSFAAGRALQDWVALLKPDEPVLVLLSGGASACVEVPLGTEAELQAQWRAWLAEGLSIAELNARRATLSALKGGGLGRMLAQRTRRVRAWVLSDVPPDQLHAVGSGPVWPAEAPHEVPHEALAGNDELVAAAGTRLGALGWSVFGHAARLAGEADAEAEALVDAWLDACGAAGPGAQVALVAGGEVHLELPVDAPRGGRCHHLALAAAAVAMRRGLDCVVVALASDGRDGSTGASGAWAAPAVLAASHSAAQVQAALDDRRSHALLEAAGLSLDIGVTGTNVNDLVMILGAARQM